MEAECENRDLVVQAAPRLLVFCRIFVHKASDFAPVQGLGNELS